MLLAEPSPYLLQFRHCKKVLRNIFRTASVCVLFFRLKCYTLPSISFASGGWGERREGALILQAVKSHKWLNDVKWCSDLLNFGR